MTNATINTPASIRREVMDLAWHEARHLHFSRRMPAGTLRTLFADALRWAWRQVKSMLECRAAIAAQRAADHAATAHLSAADLHKAAVGAEVDGDVTEAHRLRSLAHEREEADRAEKRAILAAAGNRFVAVTFIKKDGTVRRMSVHPTAIRAHVKGAGASEVAQVAAQRRAENNPHLLNVWDAKARAPRSVNLDTVLRIAADGREHLFAPAA